MTQPQEKLPVDASPTTEFEASDTGSRAPASGHTPVRRVGEERKKTKRKTAGAGEGSGADRRDIFSDAMRETLAPFAGLIERKINPLLAALEALPNDVERFTGGKPSPSGGTLDQPHVAPPLPPDQLTAPAGTGMRFLRPPGAATGGQFETLCTMCGKCVEVCPAHAIQLDQYGLMAGRHPYIMPEVQPCVVCDSLACMKECPSGALKLVDRARIKMGTARVNLELCVRETGEECRICLDACPIMGDAAGPEGGALYIHEATGRVRVRRRTCVGCGLCENRCPTRPAAITVAPYRDLVDPIVA